MFTAVRWHSSELCGKLFGQGIKQKAVQDRLSAKMRSVWVFQGDVTESCASSTLAEQCVSLLLALEEFTAAKQRWRAVIDSRYLLQMRSEMEYRSSVHQTPSFCFYTTLYHDLLFLTCFFSLLIPPPSSQQIELFLSLTPRQSAVRWHLKPHRKPVWMWRVVWMTPKPGAWSLTLKMGKRKDRLNSHVVISRAWWIQNFQE